MLQFYIPEVQSVEQVQNMLQFYIPEVQSVEQVQNMLQFYIPEVQSVEQVCNIVIKILILIWVPPNLWLGGNCSLRVESNPFHQENTSLEDWVSTMLCGITFPRRIPLKKNL